MKGCGTACVIAILIALLFGIFTICQVYLLKDTYPVSKLWVGSDYIAFYNATKNLIRGVSLYENIWLSVPDYLEQLAVTLYIGKIDNTSWYCFPPIPAYVNYPLSFVDMETASRLMFFILVAAVLCAFALISSSFESIPEKERKIIFLCGLIIITLSHPFYFLIKPDFFYFFPAFGLFLVMIGGVLFKLWFWRMGSGGKGNI